jgi:ubiquinone/menaquinone biosynthesis C-methylase UbiE
MSIRAAYDASADAWASGPEALYARLAEALLDLTPVPLAGATVLDVGTGTGVVARAAHARGARTVVGADFSRAMLSHRGPQVHGVVADAARLPFAAGTFDIAVSGFCLSHLEDPEAAVVESRRVAPVLLASAFAHESEHPAKAVVDEVLAGYGFDVPPWYEAFKGAAGAGTQDEDEFARLALRAGFSDVDVLAREVDAGLRTPADVVAWRWGMAHLAPFVAGMSPPEAARARTACETAVEGLPPVRVSMLALRAL